MRRSTPRLGFAFLLAILWSGIAFCPLDASEKESMWVYVAGNGIHQYDFDLATGALLFRDSTDAAKPTFLAFCPNHHFVYGTGKSLSAFAIDPKSGKLSFLNAIDYQKHGLCHLTVDKTGNYVLCAGYGDGTVLVQHIEKNGHLGKQTALIQHQGSSVVKSRQNAPHAHSVNLDSNNQFAFVADLGTDDLFIYRFDATNGTLEPNNPASISLQPGAGPRHFAFHPNGHFAYVINELDSTVGAYRYDATIGRLKAIETLTTLPEDFQGKNSTAEVVVHPSGRFLYGSNRGHNSIALFAIDQTTGKLTFVDVTSTGGNWPRNFCVDPTGQFLLVANKKSNHVRVFRIDQQNGRLKSTSHSVEVPNPSCIRFLQPKTL